MTTTTRRAATSRPVLAAAVLLAAAATPGVAQGPPAGAPPPNARFDTSPVRLGVTNLNLPPGFGVGVGPGRLAGGSQVAGVAGQPPTATGNVPQQPPPGSGGSLVFVPADPPPPSRLLPGARLNVGSISGFGVSSLSLPTGFGVGVVGTTAAAFGSATTGAGAAAGVAAAPARWSGPLTFVAADPAPPARLPVGAKLGSGSVSFGESSVSPGRVSNVNFGGSSANLGGVGAGFGGAATDLGGMSVQAEGGGLRFTLGADVLFDFDKFNLRAEADPILRKLVEQVRAEVPSRVRYMVEGHTDAKGTDVYNLGLSNRRARSVRDWFVKQGAVTPRDITTVGLGEGDPVAPNERPDGSDDPEGRQRNRRVEILVTPLP